LRGVSVFINETIFRNNQILILNIRFLTGKRFQ